MNEAIDGGPAFAGNALDRVLVGGTIHADGSMTGGEWEYRFSGMSLRDYFAGRERSYPPIPKNTPWTPEELAAWRYRCADAMLVERKKP